MHQFPASVFGAISGGVRKGQEGTLSSSKRATIVDDTELVFQGALQGVALAFVAEHEIAQYLADGSLVRVLQDWCQQFPDFSSTLPGRLQQTAALTVDLKTEAVCLRESTQSDRQLMTTGKSLIQSVSRCKARMGTDRRGRVPRSTLTERGLW
jgi:hypothetical protein